MFKWEGLVDINKYLLVITIEDKSFKREIHIFDDDSEVSFTLRNIKGILKRSGVYQWHVKAIQQRKEIASPVRTFRYKCNNQGENLPPLDYIHALEIQFLHHSKTSEFQNFLQNVESKYSFQDFKSLGIVFQQRNLFFSSLDFLEKIYLLSQTGMGLSLTSRMILDKNVYFCLYPAVDISTMWFSTGINRFASNFFSFSFGFDLELMPRRYMAFSVRWLPEYQIRYANKNKELEIFNGEGWQISAEFVISNNIIRKFNFLGMKIDLEKLPIGFTYNRIRDTYSNHVIETRMIYFIYLI
ncbi:MAG: hypothetical protein R6V04_07965 [bacterium]